HGLDRRGSQGTGRLRAPSRAPQPALARGAYVSVEDSRFDPMVVPHLHPEAVVPGLRKRIREGDLTRRYRSPLPIPHVHLGQALAELAPNGIARLAHEERLLRGDGDRTGRMQVHE